MVWNKDKKYPQCKNDTSFKKGHAGLKGDSNPMKRPEVRDERGEGMNTKIDVWKTFKWMITRLSVDEYSRVKDHIGHIREESPVRDIEKAMRIIIEETGEIE